MMQIHYEYSFRNQLCGKLCESRFAYIMREGSIDRLMVEVNKWNFYVTCRTEKFLIEV